MTNKRNKGFTIVELVIVIAVIAILAAVLIPTFTNLIKKAKKNKDIQLVHNLNIAIGSDKINKTHNTMSEALSAAQAYGYDIAKINASATNNEILWDSENDVFCYLNDGRIEYLPDSVDANKKLSANDYKLWKIYTKAPATGDKYSIYVGSQEVADYVNTNEVSVGVDCGSYVTDNVRYTNNSGNAQSVVINTNGGTLTINAALDTVRHYGEAIVVNVQSVADTSYHEFGKTSFVKLGEGRIVVNEEAKVGGVHVVSNDVIVAVENTVAMPTVTYENSVTTFKVQTTDNKGTEKTQSTVTISGSEISTEATEGSEAIPATVAVKIAQSKQRTESTALFDAIVKVVPSTSSTTFQLSINNEPVSEIRVGFADDKFVLDPINLADGDSFPENVANWSTSDSNVVSAPNKKTHIVTISGRGSALITGTTANGSKAYCVVHVDDVLVDASQLGTKEINYSEGNIIKITANAKLGEVVSKTRGIDDKHFPDYTVSWRITSGNDIATIIPINDVRSDATYKCANLEFSQEGTATVELTVTDQNGNGKSVEREYTYYTTPIAQIGETVYYKFDSAWNALKTGDTITLLNDVVVNSISSTTVGVPVSIFELNHKNVTLDLGAHFITLGDGIFTGEGYPSAIYIFNMIKNATLTINATGGGIDTKATNAQTVYIATLGYAIVTQDKWEANKGNVVINGGNFYGGPTCVHVYAGTATINGGRFELNENAAAADVSYLINVQDDRWSSSTITTVVSITGGEYVGFDPSADPEGVNTTYVAANYVSTETSSGIWTVTAQE